MKLSTYLHFSGNCEEAFSFYEKCLGGKIQMTMRFGDAPPSGDDAAGCGALPEDWKSKIMHTSLEVDGSLLMGSDAPPQYQCPIGGFAVSVAVKEAAEGKRVFDALSEGGTVTMPYAETFWALGFGMATDKFGVSWMINCERPM